SVAQYSRGITLGETTPKQLFCCVASSSPASEAVGGHIDMRNRLPGSLHPPHTDAGSHKLMARACALLPVFHAQMDRSLRCNYVNRSPSRQTEADFSVEKYGVKTREKEECDEQLLAEYAALLAFFVASV